jgi:hypothetical protein
VGQWLDEKARVDLLRRLFHIHSKRIDEERLKIIAEETENVEDMKYEDAMNGLKHGDFPKNIVWAIISHRKGGKKPRDNPYPGCEKCIGDDPEGPRPWANYPSKVRGTVYHEARNARGSIVQWVTRCDCQAGDFYAWMDEKQHA